MNTSLIIVIYGIVCLLAAAVIVYTIVGLVKMSRQMKAERKYFRDKYGKF